MFNTASLRLALKKPDNVSEKIASYKKNDLVYYFPLEEVFNVITHSLGVVFGLIMLVLMLLRASTLESFVTAVMSPLLLTVMFACSTAYHYASDIQKKRLLRRVDYAAINLTVLACGTAACLLYGNLFGYIAYGLCVTLSLLNALLCLFCFSKVRYLSVVSNFINGGMLAIVYVLVWKSIPLVATQLYIAGIALVLVGAILFGVKFRYAHSIFHVFVLVGPMCCMLSNYFQLV